jgi:hypothetical protein
MLFLLGIVYFDGLAMDAGWSPFIGRKWFGVVGFFSCMACPSDGQVELFLIFFVCCKILYRSSRLSQQILA